MPKKGFVDRNLFGLKDRLSNPADTTTEETGSDVDADESNEILQRDENPTKADKQDKQDIPLDKEFSKALSARKKEFVRIRSDIFKKIKASSENLPHEIKQSERWLAEAKQTKSKLNHLAETISRIDEKEWDKRDYSQDLADAMKQVENARLELFTLQMKTDCLEEEDTPGLEKHNSIIPELMSLSAWQLFKMGISFFLPLIIGLLLTGIIISIAILVAMGTL